MDKQEITNRLKQLPADYQAFILSGLPQEIVDTFAEAHDLDEDLQITLEDGFTLYLLFFITETNFIRFVALNLNLETKPAGLLVKGMKLGLPKEIYTFLNETNNLLTNQDTAPGGDFASEIAEAEKTLESLDNVRTMHSDQKSNSAQGETTYPSLQADILTNNNSAPAPKPPRWGSES